MLAIFRVSLPAYATSVAVKLTMICAIVEAANFTEITGKDSATMNALVGHLEHKHRKSTRSANKYLK